jgi:HD-GYP domain-containing protein (c-di-GMP phosphodiesterase class II)
MSSAEQRLNPTPGKADQSIETIYTTVESQRDQTDWLTVVSNLRQVNRQLVEEIARLEQALASTKQTLHTHQEASQSHEITILQQQDELAINQDRVGALFQQLETSHQIGQRQQTLIETLSEQLEIVRSIVPQIESEHEQLRQQYQQQSQKLVKTERVAIELHRRLKLQASGTDQLTTTTETTPKLNSGIDIDLANDTPVSGVLTLESLVDDAKVSVTIDPTPPREISHWTPSAPKFPASVSASNESATSWREAIIQERSVNRYNNDHEYKMPDLIPRDVLPAETVGKESTVIEDLPTKLSPNWPSPTLDRNSLRGNQDRAEQSIKIDLPKFPRKSEE